jgi:D-arabinose 1-dehydrogenase-like Zn-dependent alcohol dehydrogenase
VIEVDDRLGYAETALTEPWACVEAAYTQRRRLGPLAGGRMLLIATTGDTRVYDFGDALGTPAEILVTGGNPAIEGAVRAAARTAKVTSGVNPASSGAFDDIVMLAPTRADDVARAVDSLAFRGVINLVAEHPLDGPVDIDVGRLHYHYIAYVGTTGPNIAAAYGPGRNRVELRAGGVTVVVGAAGPMGQMHAERALGLPEGPRLVLAVDLDPDRLAAAKAKLAPVAAARGRELIVELIEASPDALRQLVDRHTDGRGADDVIVTAPSAQAVVSAADAMSADGMLVLFAGVAVGTRAAIDLSPVYLNGRQYTGTSGSRIADQERVVEKSLARQLEPRRAVAAVGGIEAAQDALRALVDGRFPGKIVLFPNLRGLPLTPLPELAVTHPDVAAALDPDGSWTREAESRLFARHLAHRAGAPA